MQLTLPTCDVLCFSCVPEEEVWSQLLEWLGSEPNRRVVIFDSAAFPQHPQVVQCGRDRQAIGELAREYVFLHFDYVEQQEGDRSLFSMIEEVVSEVSLCASDFRERGVDRLQNLLRNGRHFPNAYPASGLFGSFNHVPAIICGAGPSLDQAVPYLRLLREKALIFAGGATMTRLSQLGVQLHFSAVIDPHPPRDIDREHGSHETPCFFQSRAHPEKLDPLQGPLLWTPGCEQDFFEEEWFDGGWNVSTYLAAIACHLGCSPIILVGVDLCGDQKQLYSGQLDESGELLQLPSGSKTKRDWLLAARYLSEFAKKHPEVEWINASDGIEFGGFQTRRLEDVSFESQFDINGMIHAGLAGLESGIMKSFDRQAIRESLSRVSGICGQLMQELEKNFPNVPDRDGEYTILEIEIEREEAYAQFAKPVWDVWRPVLARSIPPELPAKEFGLKLNQWLFIKGMCDDARQV